MIGGADLNLRRRMTALLGKWVDGQCCSISAGACDALSFGISELCEAIEDGGGGLGRWQGFELAGGAKADRRFLDAHPERFVPIR